MEFQTLEVRGLNKSSLLANKAKAFVSPFEDVCCRLYGMIEETPQDVFCIIDSSGTMHGVFSYTRGQLVLPCLPYDRQNVKDALQDFFYNHRVFCLSGKIEFCRIAKTALYAAATQSLEEERLFYFFKNEAPPESKVIPGITFFQCCKKDSEEMMPLQLEYIKEEVLPKKMKLNPPVERLSLDRVVKKGGVYALKTTEGKICAKAQINARSPRYELVGGVFTAPEYRGKGFASFLMSSLIQKTASEGRRTVLFAGQRNAPALSLYRSLGFKEIGEYSISYFTT